MAPFLLRKELADAGIVSSLARNDLAKSTSAIPDRQGSTTITWQPVASACRRLRETREPGPTTGSNGAGAVVGRDKTVNNGQPR